MLVVDHEDAVDELSTVFEDERESWPYSVTLTSVWHAPASSVPPRPFA